jgi:hypothetical protein
MAHDHVKFGRVLEESSGDRKLWFFVVPAILALIALAGVGIYGISQSSTVKQDLATARAKADELQKSVDERDKLLVAARADESVLRSPGQAIAIFYGIDPGAVESGVAVAIPADRAAKVILYGLQPPPEGQRYTLAARAQDGTLAALRDVPIGGDGSAFLLAKNVPEGTTALELVLRDASLGAVGEVPASGGETSAGDGTEGAAKVEGEGASPPSASPAAQASATPTATAPAGTSADSGPPPTAGSGAVSLEGATPRIAARFPQEQERGVITQPPAAQARRPTR